MNRNRLLSIAVFVAVAVGSVVIPAQRAAAQNSTALKLWVDRRTGQVFIRPGRGRVPIEVGGTVDQAAIEKKVEQKVEAKTQTQIQKSTAQLQASNASLTQQVHAMQPAWNSFSSRWLNKIKIGTTIYGDYSLYTHTGYGPQFLTQINPPGPGNNMYNSFDITRAYLNFFFSPDKNFTVRVTPNIYRQYGSAGTVNVSKNSYVGSNIDGNLTFRLKYALLDWNTIFQNIPMLRGGKMTVGQLTDPLVDWNEHLWGFRYVALTNWNWMSLSSTYPGLAIRGPIKFGNSETQYANYDIGVFDNAPFHSNEESVTKQVMARLSVYPFGTEGGGHEAHKGFGVTAFYGYGYTGKAADYTTSSTADTVVRRLATFVHYQGHGFGLAGEFDDGTNAFSAGHLWSASAPPSDSNQGILSTLFQNPTTSHQIGYAFFGHYDIPRTPFTLFGYFQQLYSNTKVDTNPFDLQRFIVGVQYAYSKHLKFALDSQNLLFYQSNFTVPASSLAEFSPSVAAKNPKGISNAVPRDTHAIFANMVFDY